MAISVTSLYSVRDYLGKTDTLPYKFLVPIHVDYKIDYVVYMLLTSKPKMASETIEDGCIKRGGERDLIHSFHFPQNSVILDSNQEYCFDELTFAHFSRAIYFQETTVANFESYKTSRIGELKREVQLRFLDCMRQSDFFPKRAWRTLTTVFGIQRGI